MGSEVAQLAEVAGLALRVRDLGQKSGPRIQSRPATAGPAQLQGQDQLQLRTYLGLDTVVVEVVLCGCFHPRVWREDLGMLQRETTRG